VNHHQGGLRVNVYYIILDGYGGAFGLEKVLGFDNRPFLQRMANRGFRDISTDRSNYLKTTQTLTGIFSLEYPQTEDRRTWQESTDIYFSTLTGGQPPALLSELQAGGYDTWFSASYIGACPGGHVQCLGHSASVDGAYMTLSFLGATPVGKIAQKVVAARRDALEAVHAKLPGLLASGRSVFIFAHHLAPHAPYSLHRDCRPRSVWPKIWLDPNDDERHRYLEQLECVNRQVERLVDRLQSLDRTALIVLQSDHGLDSSMNWTAPIASWTDAAVRERASFLNLVLSPPACERWLDRRLGQINTARFVVACVQGRPPDYLPERTYLSAYTNGVDGYAVREWLPAEIVGSAPP
jgi:hypothetical protein